MQAMESSLMNDQTHHITLRFADGATHSVQTEVGRSVLDVALQAGAPLIHQCHSGSCSSCIATLCEGDAVTQPGATASLLSSEYAAGQRLLCITRAQSDCVFELPYTSTAGQIAPATAHAFVDGVERPSSGPLGAPGAFGIRRVAVDREVRDRVVVGGGGHDRTS